ncbi:MAG: alkane 1-monooxygenase [Shewanella psychromarinicola]|jgi:alkane 1-monooxygenase|uniref:alkane 1-monooxygenase n=1 Tax=Shewanella psychromarinicola TaxID=2487742 RepID=UPI003EEC6C4E
MFKYLKFMSFHLMALIAIASITLGESYISIGFAIWVAVYLGGDILFGDDVNTPSYQFPALLTWQLWLALPLTVMLVFVSSWQFASQDIGQYGALITRMSGHDVLLAREHTSLIQYGVMVIYLGLVVGVMATITGHELSHRTWQPLSLLIGRWLLAFSFDANFAIEHVYGHHKYVSTLDDPATAPRGRNVYVHIVMSTIKGNISAWHIERQRLMRKQLALLSWHNKALRGYAMSLVIMGWVFWLAGWQGVSFFVLMALWAKATLEIVNYMEHYGLVRAVNSPVQPHHSWNTNKRVSSWAMFNLTRHSHHHAQGQLPYHQLSPYPHAPQMIGGYLSTFVITLIPPLWHQLMLSKLQHWDAHFATAIEYQLALQANANSGIAAYQTCAKASI